MQQIVITSLATGGTGQFVSLFFNGKDLMNTAITLGGVGNITNPFFLVKLESQQTNKIKYFNPFIVYGSANFGGAGFVNTSDRYIYILYKITLNLSEDFSTGLIKVGTDDFPLGLFNLTIYEMETAEDYNPDNALATLFNGLTFMQTTDSVNYFESVKYKQYNNNDSDTNSVYITNTI